MPLLDHVCRAGGCWRSFHTQTGRDRHEEREHDQVMGP